MGDMEGHAALGDQAFTYVWSSDYYNNITGVYGQWVVACSGPASMTCGTKTDGGCGSTAAGLPS